MSALPNQINYQEGLSVLPENTTNFNVSCVPVSGSSFGPSSQIQVDLGNRGFLDPASIVIKYKLNLTVAVNADVAQIPATPVYVPFLRLETLVNSMTVETINNYSTVANMLTNLQLSVADKYGQQYPYGFFNTDSTASALNTNLDGYVGPVALAASPLALSLSAPLYGMLSGSEKLIPLFLLNNIRLQFTLDTLANIQTAIAANVKITNYTISNFEICYNMIDFGAEVQRDIIMMNPKLRIKTQSYSTGVQTLNINSSGAVNLVYNQRFASVKSAYLSMGGGDAAKSANRMFDSYDITSNNGDYTLQIGSVNYPQKALSTTNNKGGILQELRRSMNTIFGNTVAMSINTPEFSYISTDTTSITQPAKFWVGFNLQKLTVPSKAFFTGVSTQNSPISAVINIGTQTSQIHTVMLILNYDAIIEIDPSTKQCVIIQ